MHIHKLFFALDENITKPLLKHGDIVLVNRRAAISRLGATAFGVVVSTMPVIENQRASMRSTVYFPPRDGNQEDVGMEQIIGAWRLVDELLPGNPLSVAGEAPSTTPGGQAHG